MAEQLVSLSNKLIYEITKLKENIESLLAIYLACGVDPNKNTIFLQSDNIYHANVSWILECLTPYGELSRMTQFKDKSRKNQNFSALYQHNTIKKVARHICRQPYIITQKNF